MLKITAIAGLLQLYAAQDMASYYEGWRNAMGASSSFTDLMDHIVTEAKTDMEKMDVHKPVMSLLETGAVAKQGLESMSDQTAAQLGDFLTLVKQKIAAVEDLAMQARGQYGFSFGGLGMPRPDNAEARAVWEAMINTGKQELQDAKKKKSPFSLLQTESATQSMTAVNMQATVQKMRTTQGKQILQFTERQAALLENEAQQTEEAMNKRMDEIMAMGLEERKPFMQEYMRLKNEAAIAKEAHEWLDMDIDQTYTQMAKYPDERTIDPAETAFDNTVDKEFEELLHDPKMQSMMQMSEEVTLTPSSLLQSESAATSAQMQMMSVAITAEGRAGLTGLEEEGTEDQGAAQALELLRMFDVHVGHFGSAPSTLASFIQTHDQLSEQEREAAHAKAVLERRVSKAISRSAQIDKLLDDAIMDYLSDPAEVEDKPSHLAEIAGAFHRNTDPLYHFSDHPFIVRYMEEQKQNAVMPPRKVQKQIYDELLKEAPHNMKMAVIYTDLDAPGTRELKILQDLVCMKALLQKMKKANKDADGEDHEIKVYVDVQGGSEENHHHIIKTVQKKLDDVAKIFSLAKIGDQETQDYATGLADFVFRLGDKNLADNHNLNLAAFKTEHLKRGGLVKADVSKPPADMCTLDNQNLEVASSKAFAKFTRINKAERKVEMEKKEKKMLSETEQWAQQQRRVEKNNKNHGEAQVDVSFDPGAFLKGFANFLKKGGHESRSFTQKTQAQTRAARAAAHDKDKHERPSQRHGANFGLYTPRGRFV